MPSSDFNIETHAATGAWIIALRGEIDKSLAARLDTRLADIHERANSGLIIDLWDVTLIDSAALKVLIGTCLRADFLRRDFALVADPGGAVARMVELVGLGRRLRLFPSVDAAAWAIRHRQNEHPPETHEGAGSEA